jgi:antitoxin (DNA-binding transcriptional repressor) of toxin-antitoxin stability system
MRIEMKLKNVLILAAMAASMFACGDAASTANNATDSTNRAATTVPATLLGASLVCEEIRDLNDEIPLSIASIKIGEQLTVVDSLSVCATIIPGENDVPKDAISACGGWWAGAGDYLYIQYEGNDAVVMAGWQAEEQEDEGYHYKELKRFSRVQP